MTVRSILVKMGCLSIAVFIIRGCGTQTKVIQQKTQYMFFVTDSTDGKPYQIIPLTELVDHSLWQLNKYLDEPRFFLHPEASWGGGVPDDANAIISLIDLEDWDSYEVESDLYSHHHGGSYSYEVVGTGQKKIMLTPQLTRYFIHPWWSYEQVYLRSYGMEIEISRHWITQKQTSDQHMIQLLLLHEIGHGLGLDHSMECHHIMHPDISECIDQKDQVGFGQLIRRTMKNM